MKVDMLMPQMGESIAEATISKWLKQPGESVQKDEIILEISTDKVDSEIPAPASGVISEILFQQGDVVPVKTKIAVIETEGKGAAAQPAAAKPSAPASSSAAASSGGAMQQVAASAPAAQPSLGREENGHAGHREEDDDDRYYSPLVKSLAEKHGISASALSSIQGTGQGGRVTKQDLMNYIDTKGSAPAAPARQPAPAQESRPAPSSSGSSLPAAARAAKESPSTPSPMWGEDGTAIVAMDGMRQAIAEHMVRSKHTSPHVYSMQEVDMTKVSNWRKKHKAAFEQQEGFSLSYTPFFLEAAVKALVKFPYVNSSVEGKKIILKKHINLGCAVALGTSGLIVPVIKRAEERNVVGLARSLNDLATRARTKKLVPDDIAGGTFTVTNVGTFGTIIGTPIINQPQVAILCLGAIKKRPVVIDDMIAIREMCYLTLSYDHRIVDGALGGQFLAFVREYLESWDENRPLF